MRRHCSATTNFQFMTQKSDFTLVFLFHLDLGLFELVNLVPYHLHFRDLGSDLTFDLLGASTLIFKLRSQLIKNLVETSIWRSLHSTMRVGVGVSDSVVHFESEGNMGIDVPVAGFKA